MVGKGKGSSALGELDPNAQPPMPVASAGAGRPRRGAAVKAGSLITGQYNSNPLLESPGSSPPSKSKATRLANSARDPSPTPDRSRPIRRPKTSESVPVAPESESDPDSPSDDEALSERLSDDEIDDEAFEDFDDPYLPCAENGDEGYEEGDDLETDVEYQSDVESDSVDPSEDGDEEDAPMSAKAKGKRPARKAAPVPKVAGSRRPKKARKTASRTGPSSKVSAEEWLRDQNKKSGIKPDDPFVKRFQQLMSALVHRLSAKCRISGTGKEFRKEQDKLNSALRRSTQTMLRNMEPADIYEPIFRHMPLKAQQILGRPNLAAKDLQGLPKGATTLELPGTYLDVLGRFTPNQILREPHPDYRFIRIDDVRTLKPFVSEADALEIRLYLGSAIVTVRARVRAHILEMNRPDTDKKCPHTAHYTEFGNLHDVVPDFRVTSVWEPEDDSRFTPLTEGLLMTYLGLQNSGEDGEYHPKETFALNLEIRADLGLPDFMRISLNRAWPLFQGIGFATREKRTCENPAHPSDRAMSPMIFSKPMGGYRCRGCYLHVLAHGKDWPDKGNGQQAKTMASAAAKEQGCANPSHNEKWDAHVSLRYNQRAGGIRCNSCAAWLKKHGRDYPFDQNGVDTTTVSKLCQNIGHENHWPHQQAVFREIVQEIRCKMCFQWHKKEGRDYPYLANGQIRRKVCENPGHTAGTDMYRALRETDGTLRCGACAAWYRKHGVDKPANS